MAKLTAKRRNALPAKSFAGPDRSYPIPDASHARNALARAAQHGSPAVKAAVRAKVHSRYPSIGAHRSPQIRHAEHPKATHHRDGSMKDHGGRSRGGY